MPRKRESGDESNFQTQIHTQIKTYIKTNSTSIGYNFLSSFTHLKAPSGFAGADTAFM